MPAFTESALMALLVLGSVACLFLALAMVDGDL